MSSHEKAVKCKFYNVNVDVRYDAETHKNKVVCTPPNVTIDMADSVINYQLGSAPEGVFFWGAQIDPATQEQFGPPQIISDGKMLTIDDLDSNKVPKSYELTLQFSGGNGHPFDFDPQIINRPG